MNILYITHVWNEIDYLPLKARWCEENELPMFVIDNMSDDGTWEWCQKANLVDAYRYDSKGSFHLDRLQDEVKKTLAGLKPDWVVYAGADLFFVTKDKLCREIEKADAGGYNLIELTPVVTMLYTGETYKEFDPTATFHFGNTQAIKLNMIFKYEPTVRLSGDSIFLEKPNPILLEGAVFNFGMTKGKARRDQTLARRQKAWKEGLKANFGHHFADAAKHDWIWPKKASKDVKTLPFAPYYKILHDQLHAKDQIVRMKYKGKMPDPVSIQLPYRMVIPETKQEKELWLTFLENSHDFALTRLGYEKALITPLIFKAGLLVFFKKEIVGCCAACEIIGGTATIMYVYVDPKHRGKGIGEVMMVTVIRKVIELGYKHINLSTASKRIAAVELYKKLGFEDENSRTS